MENHLEPHHDRLRERIVHTAREVLDGRRDLLDGAKTLRKCLSHLGFGWDDPEYAIVALIDTETEHLPIGEERKNWAPGALGRKEGEIQRALAWAKECKGIEACRVLVERFSSPRRTDAGY